MLNTHYESRGKLIILGLQHCFVMFGATVLVPIITGLDVSVALFAAGVGTLIFHFLTKWKVPVFLGSSFAFITPILAITTATGDGGLGLDIPTALGGIAIAGLLYIVVSIIFKFVNVDVLKKLLPAHVTGPMIILIGLMLAPIAIDGASSGWGLAVFTLGVGIFVKIFFDKIGKKFIASLPVIMALAAGFLLAAVMGKVDFTTVKEAAWIGAPSFALPKFNGSAILIAVPVAVVTMIEHFGDILAIGNVVGKDFIKDPGISRTLLGDGLATTLSACVGGPANTTYSENTGAVAITGIYNPWVMRIAAFFAIILSFSPKFAAIIGVIPGSVIGGISILLFGSIASIGIKNMVDARIDVQNPSVLFTIAIMLVLGLGGAVFNIGKIQLAGLALAAITGIILNLLTNIIPNRK